MLIFHFKVGMEEWMKLDKWLCVVVHNLYIHESGHKNSDISILIRSSTVKEASCSTFEFLSTKRFDFIEIIPDDIVGNIYFDTNSYKSIRVISR